MKHKFPGLTLILILMILNNLFSQINLKVEVISKQGNAKKDVKVWITDGKSGKEIIKRTDANGRAIFEMPAGDWTLNFAGLPKYKEYEIPEGVVGDANISLTYDEKDILEENDMLQKRPHIQFTEIDQTGLKLTPLKENYSLIKVKLFNSKNAPVKKIPVKLVSIKQKTVYLNKGTGPEPVLTFGVPAGENYIIDAGETKNIMFTSNIFPRSTYNIQIEYEPTNIIETSKNDTITQQLATNPKPTTARSLVTITVKKPLGEEVWPDEPVYLTNIITGKTYKGTTDKDGKVVFLIPNGDKYMLHFRYQKDIDVINLTRVTGLKNVRLEQTYYPDPQLQYPEQFIPNPETLYLEEFQSFITKQFEQPKEKNVGLFLKWGNDKVNSKSKEAILELGVTVKNDTTIWDKTPPVNLAFVLDRSGSMAGYDRIETLKKTMLEFVDMIRPTDKIGLISFNHNMSLDFPVQLKNQSGAQLKRMIIELDAGGGTNIYNPMVLGYEQLLQNFNPNGTNKLILLTDGYGETEPKIIIDKSKEYNAKGLGITTIGVGADYNYALLSLLASQGGGHLDQVKDAANLQKAIKDQLYSLIFPVAQQTKLTLTFNQRIVFDQLYGFPVKSKENNKITIDIGDLYGGVNKLGIASFTLKRPDPTIENEPVKLEISYYDVIKKQNETITQMANLKWDAASGEVKLILDQEIKKLYAIAIMNQSIKVMVEAFASKDYLKAKNTLDRAFEQVKELFPDAKDKDVDQLVTKMTFYSKGIANAIKNK